MKQVLDAIPARKDIFEQKQQPAAISRSVQGGQAVQAVQAGLAQAVRAGSTERTGTQACKQPGLE